MTDQPATSRRSLVVPQPAMTLDEIAAELGVTKERVRQIERKALNRLRRELSKRGITADDIF